ncbi:MAG: ABC transporter ATP-binding protein [Elusimicrobiota bacterium]
MIKTVGLTKQFNRTLAVDNLNLEIADGEIFAYLGPNGAGKTTTLKMLLGLLKPTKGYALVGGLDPQKDPMKVKHMTGLVPEYPYLYRKLTGFEYLNFVADLYHLPKNDIDRIPEVLKTFGLEDWMYDMVESYSHGMQQKLALSAIVLRQPKFIFLDEPLIGLDPLSQRKMREILVGLAKKGATILICTHILEIAEKVCTRVGIINKGQLTHIGTIDELRKKADTDAASGLEDIFFKLTE